MRKKHAYCFVIQYIVQKLLSTDFKLQVQMFCSLMQVKRLFHELQYLIWFFFCKPDCPRFYETFFIRPILEWIFNLFIEKIDFQILYNPTPQTLFRFFGTFIFKTTLLLKSGPIFDKAAKIGKATWYAYNLGEWLIL